MYKYMVCKILISLNLFNIRKEKNMANKKYASLNTLQTFLDNLKNLFATQTTVEELSTDVAYINAEDNENVTDIVIMDNTLNILTDDVQNVLTDEYGNILCYQ